MKADVRVARRRGAADLPVRPAQRAGQRRDRLDVLVNGSTGLDVLVNGATSSRALPD
ncbi:hypothetical protein [Nonomuraea sp. NPDC050786]|uniref:hypothetical protein n=1 Tax=Nonomuraea sp. NPDC050786 TaxID=3154840 RepID=UPI0033C4AD92